MIRIIGISTVALALGVALYGMVAAIIGVHRRDAALVRSARTAAYANFALLLISNLAMMFALLTHDFSVAYVAQVGSRSTPAFFTAISLWSSLEGSILFWGLILSLYTAAAMYRTGPRLGSMGAYANAVMLGVGAFFYMLLVAPANPWGLVSPVPLDGPGPNPLLQNHWLMGVHPPLLYLGYVGMTVPFAFAMGALLSGRIDDLWLRVTRRWTLIAWMFLSLAIIAGMWWSYAVLGWGGYWAWDPVENASFMPWLTATAFLHSSMVQERRNMLRVWNMTLIIATFLLTVLGTFLTRSGIISSVHAFTNGQIGIYFLTFIGVMLVLSLALLSGRTPALKTPAKLDSMLSRETAFMFNNLLFAAFTFTVLLGTLFPIIAEAVIDQEVSVGRPFFNQMTLPLCAALLFLLGVGPMLPWRAAKTDQLRRESIPPAIAFLVSVVLAAIAMERGLPEGIKPTMTTFYGLLAFGFSGFALVANVQQFTLAASARRRAGGGSFGAALWAASNANRRRFGGYIAHLGILIIALGIAASSIFRTEVEKTLNAGESMTIGDYSIRFDSLYARREPHRDVVGAFVAATAGGREIALLRPRLNYYTERGGEVAATPGIRSTFNEDLYLILKNYQPNPGAHVATFDVIIEPWVSWIWWGGLVIALGAIFGSIPRRGERVPTDAPHEPARVPERETVPAGSGV
ncbi:MAG TPA: heme lyase CcmF/NrfE family subunit [Longimicrobiales bacterium]